MGRLKVTGKGSISIGDDFMFVSGEHINPISSNLQGSIYAEEGSTLTIGSHVGMTSTRIWVRNRLTIGNHVNIGACCLIIDNDAHPLDHLARRGEVSADPQRKETAIQSAPITIEDDVWIGAHCIILKGVTIGARSVIGAGSVVTKDIPADSIVVGNPCRVIKTNL